MNKEQKKRRQLESLDILYTLVDDMTPKQRDEFYDATKRRLFFTRRKIL